MIYRLLMALLTVLVMFLPLQPLRAQTNSSTRQNSAMQANMPAELSSALKSLARAGGFSAVFRQALHFSDGSVQRYRGEVDVLTPGRFRWYYIKPFEQLFVSDGFTIWHYEPDLMQVMVLKEMRDVDPAVMKLLDGSIRMKDVHLLEADAVQHRYYVRIGAGTRVWIGLHNGRLDYIESFDVLGNRNRLTLEKMKMSAPDAGRFAFVVPEGVDVVPLR